MATKCGPLHFARAPTPLRSQPGNWSLVILLIVDNNSSIRHVIRSIVSPVAEQIYECENGADARAAYLQHQPDFVLMDISMKSFDGLTATRQIREVDPQARVIVVTDYDEGDLREAASRAGACGYVLKENLLELVGVLQQLAGEEPRPGGIRHPGFCS
jgi:CheY-like chemotaxis protein